MRARTAQRVAGSIAAGSVALMAGGLVLAYVGRHRVPAGLTNWDFSDVFAQVVNLSIPVAGFVLASRRPANRIGWLALTTGLCLGLSRFGSSYGVLALVAAPGSLPGLTPGTRHRSPGPVRPEWGSRPTATTAPIGGLACRYLAWLITSSVFLPSRISTAGWRAWSAYLSRPRCAENALSCRKECTTDPAADREPVVFDLTRYVLNSDTPAMASSSHEC